MGKKLWALLLVLCLLSGQVFAVSLFVDGQRLYPDAEPVILDGRTLVPLRAIFEALGAQVNWDQTNASAFAVRDSTTITVTAGSMTAFVNGEEQALDVPAQVIQNRMFTPVRFVAEALDAQVSWDPDSQTVYIDTPQHLAELNQSTPPAVQPKPQAPVQNTPSVSEPPEKGPVTIYVTKTGKRYHYSSTCNGGTYYPSTLEEALRRGLTPCSKCVP